MSRNGSFQHDDCDKSFDEAWKMNAHKKNHNKYLCDHCDKMFKYQDINTKHIKISHENMKLYCHYFNNEKVCPFDEECVFLHEDSGICKYGAACERDLCMFQHVEVDNSDTNEDVEDILIDEDNDEPVDVIQVNQAAAQLMLSSLNVMCVTSRLLVSLTL